LGSSKSSGFNVHNPKAMKVTPRIPANNEAETWVEIQLPAVEANPWFRTVAIKMPPRMGTGFLKRAARERASSWVLSPISLAATRPKEAPMVSRKGMAGEPKEFRRFRQ
jgi:hypothetical protein